LHTDLDKRKVTAQGYLLSDEGDLMSAHDPKHKVFSHFSLTNSSELPAPYFFERFNFNPFEIFGWFRSFKLNNDSKTFIYSKHISKHVNVDEY
jgi:hypothetical protein